MASEDRDRLRLALVAARLGEWSWEATTDVVSFSSRAAEIYGVQPGPVMTWTQMRELLHPDDREPARLAVETALADKADYIIEYRLINGSHERRIAVSGRGHYDDRGRPVAMSGFVHDRTREQVLESLDEQLRPLAEAGAITRVAAEFLGRCLHVDRCAYATVEADEDHFALVGDYVDGVRSIVGRYRFRQFGEVCQRLMRAGQPFVVSDRHSDPRLKALDHDAYDDTQIEAVICVPVHKAGRFVASMAVHCKVARIWSREEVDLVQAVASRCWESIERSRIETTLRDNEDRYRALLGHVADIFWTARPDGQMTHDSTSWRAFTGQSHEEWLGAGWLDAVHPDDRRRHQQEWADAVARGRPVDTEYRLRHRDGGWRWMAVRVVPIIHPGGRIVEWFGMNSDMTARKLAERRDAFLVRLDDATRPITEPADIAETVLRLLCEELGADRATYFEIDDDGHAGTVLADYAPRLCKLQGVYPLEEYGADFARAVRSGITYQLDDIEQARLTAEERKRFDGIGIGAELMVPLLKADRLKATLGLFQAKARNWQPEEIKLCYLVVQRCWDSLERVRIEREVRLADQRKDEFIATLAHELRNPLAPIRTGLSLLRIARDTAMRDRMETMMERQVDHLVRMVDDLLDVSRISRGKIEIKSDDVALQETLAHAVEAALAAIQAAQHQLETSLPEEPVWVRGDPERLTQVFANLLNNAAKFTPPRGRIRVTLSQDDGRAVVGVEDDGIGIPASLLPEIFETFVQGPDARKHGQSGLGIGLSLVRRLVTLHGGQVVAQSAGPDRGSRFEVRLPLAATRADPVPPVDVPPSPFIAQGRLLVVDDNRDAADAITELLRALGWQVDVAYDGRSALASLKVAEFELVFIDLGMPEMDGYQLAREIRAIGPLQPALVALTGWGQAKDRAASREAGFNAHLVKPVSLHALQSVLRDVLATAV